MGKDGRRPKKAAPEEGRRGQGEVCCLPSVALVTLETHPDLTVGRCPIFCTHEFNRHPDATQAHGLIHHSRGFPSSGHSETGKTPKPHLISLVV